MPLIRLDVPVSLPTESWPEAVNVIYEALRSAFGVPHCIDGQATGANQRIAEALGIPDADQDPGDEGDGDMDQAS
jgi:hypothetical protein